MSSLNTWGIFRTPAAKTAGAGLDAATDDASDAAGAGGATVSARWPSEVGAVLSSVSMFSERRMAVAVSGVGKQAKLFLLCEVVKNLINNVYESPLRSR